MPSTGTAQFTVTRDQLSSAALRVIGVLQDSATASTQQLTDAGQAVNIILKQAMSSGLLLWTYQLIEIPLVQGKITYTIGPVGTDVVKPRPLRLFEGSYIRNVCANGQTFDTPLRLISWLEYLQFGGKNEQAVVNSIYYDSKIDLANGTTSANTGYGTLYVWPAPLDASRSLFCNFQRQLYDMTSGTDEFDLPAEAFQWLKFQLAAELAYEYRNPLQEITLLEKKANMYKDSLFDWSVETASVYMQPDASAVYRR